MQVKLHANLIKFLVDFQDQGYCSKNILDKKSIRKIKFEQKLFQTKIDLNKNCF